MKRISRDRRWWHSAIAAAPSLAAAGLTAAVVIQVSAASDGMAAISTIRMATLAAVGVLGAYLVASAFGRRLRRINNIVLLNVALAFAGTELVMRLMADKLPLAVVDLLPEADKRDILSRRGLFTLDTMQGNGLLYSWKPETIVAGSPWLRIDRFGYRNPDDLWREQAGAIDVVLLGDSVTIAQNTPHDLGNRLREAGIAAVNLGFSGYGPPTERDAYKALILDRHVAHRLVVVNFCICNDVTDAQHYRRLIALGRDWRDYLGTAPSPTAFPFSFDPPWTVSAAFHLPYAVVNAIRRERAAVDATEGTDGGKLVGTPLYSDAEWGPAVAALTEIATLARSAGSRLLIGYYPDTVQIRTDDLAQDSPERAHAVNAYDDARTRLETFADSVGARFIDYTPAIRDARRSGEATAAPDDYHPNQRGVDAMAAVLLPVVAGLLRDTL